MAHKEQSMLDTSNIFILTFSTIPHLCYDNVIIMPPGNCLFPFLLRNAKWFPHLISFNLTTSWWGSSVLIYRWDPKLVWGHMRNAENNGDTNCGSYINSLQLRKSREIPTSLHGVMRKMSQTTRTVAPLCLRLFEMKRVPGRRPESLTQKKLCSELNSSLIPQVIFFPLLWHLHPLPSVSQCSGIPTPHQPSS